MLTAMFMCTQTLDLNSYRVTPLQNAARHEVSNKEGNSEEHPPVSATRGIRVTLPLKHRSQTFTFVFPTYVMFYYFSDTVLIRYQRTGVTVTDTMWYTMRTVPISATKVRDHKKANRHSFEMLISSHRRGWSMMYVTPYF